MTAPAAAPVRAPQENLQQELASPEAAERARRSVQYEAEPKRGGKTLHRFRFPDGAEVEFSDRPGRGGRVIAFLGEEHAETEPASTFEAAGRATGLTPEAVDALRFVSTHEGGFDAINTWDHARFSWGFIQFAGGRGLPKLLAHMKERSPELFSRMLGDYGVDVLPDENGDPQPVYTDPESGRRLKGKAAERAYADDPLTVAAFIRAARYTAVKQLQIEAAIQHYVSPALNARHRGVPLGQILRSPKALAMLIDRKVHEGNVRRFTRALRSVGSASPAVEEQVLGRVLSEAGGSSSMIRNRLQGIWRSDLPGPRGF